MPPKFAQGPESDDDMPEMNMEQMRLTYAMRLCPPDYARLLVESLPAEKQTLVKGLQGLQNDIDQVLLDRALAIEDVRRKFQEKLGGLFARRAAVVAGTATPTDAEVAAAFGDENVGGTPIPADHPLAATSSVRGELATARSAVIAKGAGLNTFWLEVFRNHEYFDQLISEKDAVILESLVDVSSVLLNAPRLGFAIRYVFGPNAAIKSVDITRKGPGVSDVESGPCPVAKAAQAKTLEAGPASLEELTAGVVVPEGGFVLVKTYYMDIDQDGDPFASAIDGTEIVWNADQNPTVVKKEKKQTRGKGKAKQTRVVQYEEEVPSFFNIFKPVTADAEEDDEEESGFERDFELGRVVSGSLIPRAVEWFTGRASGPSSPFGDEEDGDMMGGESDDDDEAPTATAGPKKNAAAGGAPQQECKQQ